MKLDWLSRNLVYVTLHGSQAYGLNNELSDVDVKGICVPPRLVENDLFDRFEQAENNPLIEERLGHLRNPKNPKFESVIYSLRKFFILAANINPSIIELLWTVDADHFVMTPLMEELLSHRHKFLSSKAKFTFAGYSFAQLAKIERHRKWIVLGEISEPKREDFGLPPIADKGVTEVFNYIKAKVEEWNLNQFPFEEKDRSELKETIWELVWTLSQKEVSWDNWPDAYAQGVIHNLKIELLLKDEVVDLIQKERAYFKAINNYKSWFRWKAERNPARRELEVKCGYDSKHAMHLVRLLRCGLEILTTGKVIVKRSDREELLAVRNGAWSYEKVMDYAKEMQKNLDESYKTTTLPKSVDHAELNELYHNLTEEYHTEKV